ncbi:MAG: DUF4365 domain-containing protein [Nostoc sp. NMS1]|uniref:DUF4365 domain-containing protein n=1 Tax=unclassified Nostoc TaxID=2593658 RepID=UPI0025DAC3AE|nr:MULTISPECIES: DUF4365 domain-containing protein [unclassified Nostoc]MBN3906792.1 DUF4365 domain-containing protein [Nostoc sp. NMS1]MBN3991252.1 DUF4365 domain-containing protein [Nostoc sp. NMS2]
METTAPWYIEKRAESLAIVYLTRRDDLIISQPTLDKGLDFLITITKDGVSSGRLFGVEVKATVSTSGLIQHNDIIKLKTNINTYFFRDFPFPVCLFFFTLDNDKAYYKWILEPNINESNNVCLIFNENKELKKLDDEEIANMISRVNSWYDQRNNP